MQIFEGLFLSSLFISSLLLWHPKFQQRPSSQAPAILTITLALLQLYVEGNRWQLVPGHLLTLALLIIAIFPPKPAQSWPRRLLRISMRGFQLLCLVIAVVLPLALPVFDLPQPTGSFQIGTMDLLFEDKDRLEDLTPEPDDKRRLMVRVWYPANHEPDEDFEAYWPNAKRWSHVFGTYSNLPTFMFSHLNQIKTHSVAQASIRTDKRWPVLLFNHGLTDGQVRQNTALMEDLASHGYVVFSIAHTYETLITEWPDGTDVPYIKQVETRFRADMNVALSKRRAYQQSDDPIEKAQLLIEKNTLEPNINRSAARWAADISFIIDQLQMLPTESPFSERLNLQQLGVFGMSFGGCAAGQAGFHDPRIKAVANLDGYPFGDAMTGASLQQPFLLMQAVHKDPDETSFIYQNAKGPAYQVYIEDTTHLSYTDIVLWGPLIQAIGLSGKIEPNRMLHITASYVRAFFDRHLLGENNTLLEKVKTFPEVQFKKK